MEKELNFGEMMGQDPDYIQLARQKAIAEALIKGTMGAQGGTFKKNPLAVVADFMTLKGGKDKLASAQEQELALMRQHKEAEAAGIQELLASMEQPGADPRLAITKALASRYPGVKGLASQLAKQNETQFGQVLQHMGNRIDVPSVIGSRGMVPNLKEAAPLPAPRVGQDPTTGRQWLEHQERDGSWKTNVFPVPTIGSLTVGDKPALETEEQMGKYYAAGGKGYDLADKVRGQLSSTQEVLTTLAQNPRMGAGAEGFQFLGKWAEQFSPGVTKGLTGTTEQMAMQLGERVIKELGGLGNQVSNSDVEFINKAMGSISSDPTALRRVAMIALKYQMRAMAKLESEAAKVAQMPAFAKRGLTFPGYNFNVKVPDAFGEEFGSFMEGTPLPNLQPAAPASRIKPR